MKRGTLHSGFTLLEILLVVAAIAILAGIVIVAINPARQLGETRDAQRKVDVRTILNAVQQYQLREGALPNTISTVDTAAQCDNSAYEICTTDSTCSDGVSLAGLTDNSAYLTSIPEDPGGSDTGNPDGSGYMIVRLSNGRITVCAPQTEGDTMVTITN
jgi:type IV pilus assembly protein PilA